MVVLRHSLFTSDTWRMAYRYKIYPEHNLTLVKATGCVTGPDILRSFEQMTLDSDWRLGLRQINDYRDITQLIILLEDLEAIAALEQRREEEGRIGEGKLAIVVRDEMYGDVCRLYEVQAKDRQHETKVFRTMEAAAGWIRLDVDPEVLEALLVEEQSGPA